MAWETRKIKQFLQDLPKDLVRKPVFWGLVVGCLFSLPFARMLFNRLPEPPPVYGVVPPITLNDERGTSIPLSSYHGQIWLLHVGYSRCQESLCKVMRESTAKIQHRSRNLGRYFQIVNISIDPDYDDKKVIEDYVRVQRASPRMQAFLTGEVSELDKIIHLFPRLTTSRSPSDLAIPEQLALIDKEGQIRGFFYANEIDLVLKTISLLAIELLGNGTFT